MELEGKHYLNPNCILFFSQLFTCNGYEMFTSSSKTKPKIQLSANKSGSNTSKRQIETCVKECLLTLTCSDLNTSGAGNRVHEAIHFISGYIETCPAALSRNCTAQILTVNGVHSSLRQTVATQGYITLANLGQLNSWQTNTSDACKVLEESLTSLWLC